MNFYPTCGCVPYRYTKKGNVEVLMVLNVSEENHWEFPKGKKDEGETDEITALRETKEETGLTGEITEGEPIEFEFDCVVHGTSYHKTVKYYYCRVPDDSKVVIQEKELGGYAWLTPKEAIEKATYFEMKEVARKVCEHFLH